MSSFPLITAGDSCYEEIVYNNNDDNMLMNTIRSSVLHNAINRVNLSHYLEYSTVCLSAVQYCSLDSDLSGG